MKKSRLTIPVPCGDTDYRWSCLQFEEDNAMSKLAEYEDLEEQYDSDLLAVFKALRDKSVVTKYGIEDIINVTISKSGVITLSTTGMSQFLFAQHYKKTWVNLGETI